MSAYRQYCVVDDLQTAVDSHINRLSRLENRTVGDGRRTGNGCALVAPCTSGVEGIQAQPVVKAPTSWKWHKYAQRFFAWHHLQKSVNR